MGDTETETTSSASGASATSGEAGEAGSEVSTSGEATSTQSSSGSLDVAEPACEAPGDARVSFWLSGTPDFDDVRMQKVCEVSSVYPGFEGGWFVTLESCLDESGQFTSHELMLNSEPNTQPFVWPGQEVRLDYVQFATWGPVDRMVTLRDAQSDTLWLAGFTGMQMPSADPSDPHYIDLAPLRVDDVGVGCEAEDTAGCGPQERRGLQVNWMGMQTTVPDQNAGYLGELSSYQIIVGQFWHLLENYCDDYPDRQFEALMLLIPEG